MHLNRTILLLIVLLLAETMAGAEPASVLLQKGIYAEETEGDLNAAIAAYRKAIEETKALRAVGAQAQYRLAICLKKQSKNHEEMAALRQLISDFPTEGRLVAQARSQLAALGSASAEIKVKKIMVQGAPAYQDVSETRLGRVSPNGRYFSFTDWRSRSDRSSPWLRVRDMKTGEIIDVAGSGKDAMVWNSVWSPDGNSLAFGYLTREGEGEKRAVKLQVQIARLDGTNPPKIVTISTNHQHGCVRDWSADGKQILASFDTNLVLVSVENGSHRIIKSFKQPLSDNDFLQACARISPDGRWVAYADAPNRDEPFQRDIYVVATDGGSESVLVQHPAHDYEPIWTPDGKGIVFASNRTGANGLWLLMVDNGKAQGEPQLIHQTMGRIHPKDFGKDGLLYYDVMLGEHDLYTVDLDLKAGKATAEPRKLNIPREGWNTSATWSPDGTEVAYISRSQFTRIAMDDYIRPLLCVHSTKTGQTRELSLPKELLFSYYPWPQWSSDGRALLISAKNTIEKRTGLYRVDALRGEATRVVKAESQDDWMDTPVMTPDGKALVYKHQLGSTSRLVLRELQSGSERELWRIKGWIHGRPALSQDGREVAFSTELPGADGSPIKSALRVVSLNDGQARTVAAVTNFIGPVQWTPDGNHLVFVTGKPGAGPVLFRVSAQGGELTELSLSSVGIASQFSAEFSMDPRSGRLVFTGPGRGSELWAVEGVDAPGAMLSRSVAASSADIKIQKIAIKGEPAYEGISETRLGRVSPDGRYFSFTDWRSVDGYSWLRVRNLETGEIIDVTEPQEAGPHGSAWNSVWSRDGKSLAYSWMTGTNEIRVARFDQNKPAISLINRTNAFRSVLDWTPDGKQILVAMQTNIVLINVADGAHRVVKRLENSLGGGDFLQPCARVSPDGKYIAYAYAPDRNYPFQRDIYVVSIDGSRESVLVAHPAHDYEPIWTPDGNAIVFASNRTGANGLWVINVANGEPQGLPRLVHQTMGRIHPKDFASNGLLYYDVHLGDNDVFVADIDPATGKAISEPRRLAVPREGWNTGPRWSPNGGEIAFMSRPNFTGIDGDDEEVQPLLCVYSEKTGRTRELSLPANLIYSYAPWPEWSPDGRKLLFSAKDTRDRSLGFYAMDAESGKISLLLQSSTNEALYGFSMTLDGSSMLFQRSDGKGTNHLVLRNIRSGNEKELALVRPWTGLPRISPDGQSIAFQEKSWESDPEEPAVCRILSLNDGSSRTVNLSSDRKPSVGPISWTADGAYLVFAKGKQGEGRALYRIGVNGGPVVEVGVNTTTYHPAFSLHPGGRKIAFTGAGRGSELWAIEGLDGSVKRNDRRAVANINGTKIVTAKAE